MSALKFRVLLDSSQNEEVFRDIRIDEKENFETFYTTILDAFGFNGKQLGSFYMSNDAWDKGEEIGLMDMQFGEENSDMLQMAETKLVSKMEEKDQKMILVYDFLKMWIFLIELQERTSDKVAKPEVVFSIGKAPDENDKSEEFNMESEEMYEESEDDEFSDEFDEFDEEGFSEDYGSYDDDY